MAMRAWFGLMLAAGAGLSACAHAAGPGTSWASATYVKAPGTGEIRAGRVAVVENRPCLLRNGDRSAVLAALMRLQPIDEPGDSDFSTGPIAGSGLVIVFRDARGPALTVLLRNWRPREGDRDAYIRVNGTLAQVTPADLLEMQAAVRRSGCRISAHQRRQA